MIPYNNYILFVGYDKHFETVLRILTKIRGKLKLIHMNPTVDDPERLIQTIERLKLRWSVVLMAGVPEEDIQEAKEYSICYNRDSILIFQDGSRIPLRDEDNIIRKLRENIK